MIKSIKKLQKLHSKATKGPWKINGEDYDGTVLMWDVVADDDIPVVDTYQLEDVSSVDYSDGYPNAKNNARYIATAYNMTPMLIDWCLEMAAKAEPQTVQDTTAQIKRLTKRLAQFLLHLQPPHEVEYEEE